MKQGSIVDKLASNIASSERRGSLLISGFHPDVFLPLFHRLNVKIFIEIPDDQFGLVNKYLYSLLDDDSVVFIGGRGIGKTTPLGPSFENIKLLNRAKELFASGLEHISLIISSESGTSIPLLGSSIKNRLLFSLGTNFNDCLQFLKQEKYKKVVFVSSPGEYGIRGGIIDVFPLSSLRPYRINFIDSAPSVFSFDVNTQLTVSRVEGFSLSSISCKNLFSLKESPLDEFIKISFSSKNELFVSGDGVCEQMNLQTITHRDFCSRSNIKFNSVSVLEGLSSIGVIDNNNNLLVPSWFLYKPSSAISVEDPVVDFVPQDISDINRGDFLVHRNHGVGICAGLTIKNGPNNAQEFLVIKYNDGGVVSVDVGNLDLISFFAASDADNIVLDSLSKQGAWKRKSSSALKRAKKFVVSILNLYVQRRNFLRAPFFADISIEKDFLSEFPYHDTPDQVSAWENISSDLASKSPMERLLCGDVGFGKTELAIRAAFRVVLSNKRVVLLAPTTILANQLYSSFSARLEPFAVSVDMISRFKSKQSVSKIKENILNGKNNVLIGTHSILNDSIYLNNIGLLIIDEEHRFGVGQKEKIKDYKNDVDVLSMSATPIPRSINLALSELCSISMLQTPPLLRRPINTMVEYYDDALVQSAVDFEVGRGGQVFFVHNDVDSIKNITSRLRALFPDYSIKYIHGQEPSAKIENKMTSFVLGKIDVLVCTSIIESGIDVPSANCIIINQSQLFGLSQLYQMRGRVGRGRHQAYAYLLVPRNISLSEKALRRIKTIKENTSLGSGYNVALSDMEIRGSGSLFGYTQSGGSGAVGYEMYSRLIQRSIHDSFLADSNFSLVLEDVVVIFFLKRLIPEAYISFENIRMSVYKNLSCVSCEKDLDRVLNNISNRFGPPPQPLVNLVNESRLRLKSASSGIGSIVRRGCGVVCSIDAFFCGDLAAPVLEYIESFWAHAENRFHILPSKNRGLSFCIHMLDDKDSYSLLCRFVDKFSLLKKL